MLPFFSCIPAGAIVCQVYCMQIPSDEYRMWAEMSVLQRVLYWVFISISITILSPVYPHSSPTSFAFSESFLDLDFSTHILNALIMHVPTINVRRRELFTAPLIIVFFSSITSRRAQNEWGRNDRLNLLHIICICMHCSPQYRPSAVWTRKGGFYSQWLENLKLHCR